MPDNKYAVPTEALTNKYLLPTEGGISKYVLPAANTASWADFRKADVIPYSGPILQAAPEPTFMENVGTFFMGEPQQISPLYNAPIDRIEQALHPIISPIMSGVHGYASGRLLNADQLAYHVTANIANDIAGQEVISPQFEPKQAYGETPFAKMVGDAANFVGGITTAKKVLSGVGVKLPTGTKYWQRFLRNAPTWMTAGTIKSVVSSFAKDEKTKDTIVHALDAAIENGAAAGLWSGAEWGGGKIWPLIARKYPAFAKAIASAAAKPDEWAQRFREYGFPKTTALEIPLAEKPTLDYAKMKVQEDIARARESMRTTGRVPQDILDTYAQPQAAPKAQAAPAAPKVTAGKIAEVPAAGAPPPSVPPSTPSGPAIPMPEPGAPPPLPEFTGAYERVKARIRTGAEKVPETLGDKVDRALSRVVEKVYDPYNPLRQYVKEAKESGVVISKIINDPYWMATMYGGTANEVIQGWMHVDGLGQIDAEGNVAGPTWGKILQPIADNPTDLEMLRVYAEALHTTTGRIPAGKPSGISDADALAVVKGIGSTRPDIATIAHELTRYRRALALYAEDAGLLEPGTAAYWAEKYPDYVPMFRVLETSDRIRTGSIGKPFRMAKGGEQPLLDPLVADVMMTNTILRAVNRQRIINDLYAIALERGQLGGELPKMLPAPPAVAVAEGIQRAIEGDVDLAPVLKDMTPTDLYNIIYAFRPESVQQPETVIFKVKGKWVATDFEPDVVRAIDRLTKPEMQDVYNYVRVLGFPARTARVGVTWAPPFKIRNFLKDLAGGFISADTWRGGLQYYGWGILDSLHFTDNEQRALANKWFKTGGAYYASLNAVLRDLPDKGQVSIVELTGQRKLKTLLTQPVHTVKDLAVRAKDVLRVFAKDYIGAAGETTGRKAAYMEEWFNPANAELSPQERHYQATAYAMERNVNFSRRTAIMRIVDSVSLFVNPSQQGVVRFGKNAFGIANVPEYGSGKIPKGQKAFMFWTKIGVLSAALMTHYATMRDDPDYWELPEDIRNRYFLIPLTVPGKSKYWFSLPLPWEIGLVARLPVAITESIALGSGQPMTAWVNSTWNTTVPQMIPIAAQPWIENWANKSFFYGGPFVPARLADVDPGLQVRGSTTDIARIIGMHLDYSPAKIENIINAYGSTLGMEGLRTLDWALTSTDLIERKQQTNYTFENWPVMDAFLRRNLENAQSISDFYAERDKSAQAHASYVLLLQDNPDEALKYWGDHEAELLKYGMYENVATRMAKFIQLRTLINKDEAASPSERAREVDKINRELTNLARIALERKPLP